MNSQKEHFHIVLPKGYKQVLKIAAARAAISISGLIQQAVDNHLRKRSSKNGSEKNDEGNRRNSFED
jgi:hypothetical protein